ncbi:cupredoxin domain-containing protein [Solirubrobacter ginsenosidimutans]|uniref:Cupredoxin domain-containing protein n=1 Tax=Solirubrobacter ginsenosidimutans TaxID=490573 RepID=A0A9X3MPB7_9ACTN|nr:cupredoxin domain-containing protein [Solirubrobacter ginsenosidimutans]MDA0159367.1 cupredoxin domain-containing protein [Solirubrobacter ginsenosidimutans]
MPASTRRLLALFTCALALAACGGAPAAVRERSSKAALTLDDYLIRPQTVSVPRGEVTFTVTNRGRLGHTFRIRGKTKNVLAMQTLEPGESKTETRKLAKGTYTMYCVLANHEELGMYGTLVVR